MRILITAIFFISSSIAAGNEISHQARLRKAAYFLTGQAPTLDEAAAVANMDKDEFREFYPSKLDQYLAGEHFPEHFKPHLLRLLRMYEPDLGSADADDRFRNENAFDNLIVDLLKENKPWRNLLLSQDYEAAEKLTDQDRGDLFFFQFVFYEELGPQLKNFVESRAIQGFSFNFSEGTRIPLRATTARQQQALAGIITTQRFFGRYPTTKINKNRGRAAALFRAFLCDPMKPIVLTNAEEDQSFLEKSLQMRQAHNGATISQDVEARHGTDPQCMACHYKLDPMASVFSGSSLELSPFAAPGALVYKTKEGIKVHQEVTGFKELADAIVDQPDYLACQVQHFWDWVIGEDIPLDEIKKQELVKAFVSVDERPKDFIKILMTSEFFYEYRILKEEDIRYGHVLPIFRRCDSCHVGDSMAPELSGGYPFDRFNEQFYGRPLVERIAIETKLSQHGAGATMPPGNAGWALLPKERDLLLAWIKNGARDNEGQPHYQQGPILEELSAVEYEEGFQEFLEPTYYTTFSRYLTGNILLKALASKFAENDFNISCNFSTNDRNTVGFPDAVEGTPVFKHVNPNYLRWWHNCLRSQGTLMREYYESSSLLANPKMLWSELSLDQKREVFAQVERHILGLGILPPDKQESIFSRANQYLASDPTKTNLDAMVLFAKSLLSSRYFLTY